MVRTPAPVTVRCSDGDPVEFARTPPRPVADHWLVSEVLERWIEESRWPFLSAMPVGGDRCRCWRVLARRSEQPHEMPVEVVLRMRSGPGVWDLRWTGGDQADRAAPVADGELSALSALRWLVELHDGPRGTRYDNAKPRAWETARAVVGHWDALAADRGGDG